MLILIMHNKKEGWERTPNIKAHHHCHMG